MTSYVIQQDVTYTYSEPVRDVHQRLIVVPKRRHGDQQLISDRFEVQHAEPAAVRRRTDRFGNTVVEVEIEAVEHQVVFHLHATVERDTTVRAPQRMDLGPTTTLTRPDAAIRAAAESVRGHDVSSTIRAMSSLVRGSFEYVRGATSVRTTAAEAWEQRQGVCQDMAHVMLAMCAALSIPARYVSGHMVGDGASHAWIEAFDADLGDVIAIDPTHDRLTDLRYVTTATGRDYQDVAPTSGTFVSSGGRGTLQVRKSIQLADVA